MLFLYTVTVDIQGGNVCGEMWDHYVAILTSLFTLTQAPA